MNQVVNGTSRAISLSVVLHVLAMLVASWLLNRAHPLSVKIPHINPPLQLSLQPPKTPLALPVPQPTPAQVVDVTDPKTVVKDPPKDAKFLSDKNRMTGKEMQAKQTSPILQSARSQPQSTPQRPQPPTEASQGLRRSKPKLDLSPNYLNNEMAKSEVASNSPSNYLPDMEMGNETLLNTKEYAFASFFIRMKRQMENIWNPQGILSKGTLDREVYITAVSIELDAKGKVLSVKIVETSGDFELDQEALRTVRDGGPYLNPPNALVEREGRIVVPKWSFIVTRKRIF